MSVNEEMCQSRRKAFVRSRFAMAMAATIFVIIGTAIGSRISNIYFPRKPRFTMELVGSFVLDSDVIHDELKLQADGSFLQSCNIKATGRPISGSGKWSYDAQEGDIFLDGDFLPMPTWPENADSEYLQPRHSSSDRYVQYWYGTIVIGDPTGEYPCWTKTD